MGKKITGTRLSPNTRYLVYQPRLTDALIVICQLLSYEHPCNRWGVFSVQKIVLPIMTSIVYNTEWIFVRTMKGRNEAVIRR